MRVPSESFVRRVRRHLDDLSAVERKLANFVLEFPGELASYGANELAALAGVSPSAVSRFVRHIGFENYEEARRLVREEKEAGSPLFQVSAGAGGHTNVAATHYEQSQANLAWTFEHLAPADLTAMAKAIVGASQVLIFGSRSSHGFALYLRWQIIQAIPRVTAIPGPGETTSEHLVELGERDCVIVFGVRRQTHQMMAVLEAATRAKARIIFISDKLTPDYKAATWSIHCECRGSGPLDNHVAVMAVCDLLATMIIDASGHAGRKRMTAIEMSHGESGEL
jgi:DNA-binding MurR/RpiR family transcriptional regulator